jgi:hypothetical protein
MSRLVDAFWRAAAYCLMPRVIALSFLPLILMAALAWGLGFLFWDAAVDAIRTMLDASALVSTVNGWLQTAGVPNLKGAIAPLLVIFGVTPVLVIVSLLVVAVMMTPAMVSLVAERRFPGLERKQGGSLVGSLLWSLGSTLLALLALVVSMLLWLVPPLILVLPPLIWGWLTYRVLTFDALAVHASRDERRAIFREHRGRLLVIGIVSGFLGAAPSLLWVSAAVVAAAFVILLPLAVWIYTLVFAFSSLWFAHYCLAALESLRSEHSGPETVQDTRFAHTHQPFDATDFVVHPESPTTMPVLLAEPDDPRKPRL